MKYDKQNFNQELFGQIRSKEHFKIIRRLLRGLEHVDNTPQNDRSTIMIKWLV